MTTLLLVIIYLAFISLGLPDTILGSAWPSMYGELNVPLAYAGALSMIISAGTIISSLFSDKLIRKFGTGLVTTGCVALTAIALMGFSFSHSFIALCICCIPYGLGAGSVDAALNNFVALHYKSRHMSWLHCFWGVGASAGPLIMGACLTGGLRWNAGYKIIGFIQILLVIFLTLSLPLWNKSNEKEESMAANQQSLTLLDTISLPGAKAILLSFFCYCAIEATAGLWASSYLVLKKGIHVDTAATWASLFYLGITFGRLISGFITDHLGDTNMVRIGQFFMVAGIILILLPLKEIVSLAGLILIGIGCAPVYPSLLHATPAHFGADKSQAIMGMQMACAYVGSTFMPPIFGFLAEHVSISLYPVYLICFILLMIFASEWVNKKYPIS